MKQDISKIKSVNLTKEFSRDRSKNLDFQIATGGREIYVKEAVVLVQSIINKNQWANKIKFHILQDNLSPEQFSVFLSFEKKYPKVEVVFIDLKTLIKEEYDWHGSSVTHYQIDALTKISPISNWVILLESSQFCVASFEPIIKKLNPQNLIYQVLKSHPLTSPLDGKLIPYYFGAMQIINYDFFIKEKIYEKFLECQNLIQKNFPNSKIFRHNEILDSVTFSFYPHGEMFVLGRHPQDFDEIRTDYVIIKYASSTLAPWHEGFPNNSLKKLYSDTANQNSYTQNFQEPDPQSATQQKFIFYISLVNFFQNVVKPLFSLLGKISPKLFRKFYQFYLKNYPRV